MLRFIFTTGTRRVLDVNYEFYGTKKSSQELLNLEFSTSGWFVFVFGVR